MVSPGTLIDRPDGRMITLYTSVSVDDEYDTWNWEKWAARETIKNNSGELFLVLACKHGYALIITDDAIGWRYY